MAVAAKYQPYPAYKPSGVEWLGDIPEGWETAPIKQVAKIENGATPKSGKASFWDGQVPWVTPADLGKGSSPYLANGKRNISDKGFASCGASMVPKGSVILSSRAPIGALGISECDMSTNQGCKSLVPLVNLYATYLYYFLSANTVALNMLGRGSTFLELSSSDLGDFKTSLPPLLEQTKIAAFLDYETAKIDALIAKQERLIALLGEKRQAVISHAVTKGLDPTAPHRPSGIDWLGDVPAHWEVCRLKHVKGEGSNAFVDGPFGSNLKSEHFSPEGEVFVIESNFATTGKINIANLKKISRRHFETIKRSAARSGDIILAKIGARYGMSSILPEIGGEAVVSGNSLKLTVNSELVLNSFALELLRHLKVQEAMDENVSVTAQPALSLGGLNNLPFLKVPLKEQQAIVEFLIGQKDAFERLLFASRSAITLLKERRTALISAAVTGKIDLRGWQAPAEATDSIQDKAVST